MADPTTVPDLRLWLKADSLASTTTNVSSWANSAPGFTAETITQGTAAAQPVYTAAALNGLPALSFDGVDDLFAVPAALLNLFRNIGGATTFFVGKSDRPASTGTTALNEAYFAWSTGGSSGAARAGGVQTEETAATRNSNLRTAGRRLDGDAFAGVWTPNDSWGPGVWKIAAQNYDWANAMARGYLDGSLGVEEAFQTAGLTSDTASVRAHVGAHSNSTSEFLLGYIAEILIYPRTLTAAERAEVHTYLSDRYGITVSDYVSSAVTHQGAAALAAPAQLLAAGDRTTSGAAALAAPAQLLASGTRSTEAGAPLAAPALLAATADRTTSATAPLAAPAGLLASADRATDATAPLAAPVRLLAEGTRVTEAGAALAAPVRLLAAGDRTTEAVAALAAPAALAAAGTAGAPTVTGLTATAVSTSRIDLAWDPFADATGYDVERNGAIIAIDVVGTTYSDLGLAASTIYDYRLRAVLP